MTFDPLTELQDRYVGVAGIQEMMCRRPRKLMVIASLLGLVFLSCFWMFTRAVIANEGCSDVQSMQYLEDLCTNYSRGLVTGSFCTPLCVQQDIQFSGCIGHGVKPHVLTALWRGTRIVMKAAQAPGGIGIEQLLPEELLQEDISITKDKFIDHARMSIYYDHFSRFNPQSLTNMIERVLRECDIGQDNILTIEEVTSCWILLETKEYIFYQLLQGNSALPQLLGVCGNLYAMQYSPSEPFLGYLTDWFEVRDWKFRVQLALGLLEMVETMEGTEFGTVYLCDIQESNFGVVKRMDGSLIVKAIDMDISFFDHSLTMMVESEQNNTCSSDQECDFVACHVKCDQRRKRCSGILSSSNLRSICTRIFRRTYSYQPALLLNPPRRIAGQLKTLLDQCSQSESPHLDWMLLKQLQTLLTNSIS